VVFLFIDMEKICIDCGYNKALKYRKICSACKSKRYRIANPVKSAYDTLKGHAKARNKEFTLTLEEFKDFCMKTDYINKKV
jgi:hypothetical protein